MIITLILVRGENKLFLRGSWRKIFRLFKNSTGISRRDFCDSQQMRRFFYFAAPPICEHKSKLACKQAQTVDLCSRQACKIAKSAEICP